MGEIFKGNTAAIVGLMTALLGTLIALILISESPSAQGELTLPALALAVGILFVPAVRALSRSSDVLRAENFVAIGFVYWILLDPIQGAYDLHGASAESIKYALIAVGISAAAMWAGTLGRPWHMPQSMLGVFGKPLDNKTLLKLIPVCFLLGMSNFAYSVNFDLFEMFSYLGEQRWEAPWSRGQLGGWDAFLDHAQYFGYLVPALAMLLVARRGFLKAECLLAMGAAVIMVMFLGQGGGRRIIGVTLGAAIIVWVLAQPGLKVKKLLGFVVGVIGILVAMQFILEIRLQGFEGFMEQGRQYEYLHVDDNLLRLAQIIDIFPAEHPFVHFQQIVFAMVRPIPRVFWEGKPIDAGFDLASTLGMANVSLSISIIGEWYSSFGWAAVIFGGWLHGRLASAANTLREGRVVSNPVVYALAVMVLVSGLRSMQDLVVMSYAILALFGVTWLVARRSHQNARA